MHLFSLWLSYTMQELGEGGGAFGGFRLHVHTKHGD